MRILNISLFSFMAIAAVACGGGSEQTKIADAAESSKVVDPEAKGGNTCLLAYSDKLDQLLTLQQAADFTQLPTGSAKADYSRIMKNPAYHSIKYSWESDRKRNMKELGVNVDVPVKNMVELHGIKESSLKNFQFSHRKPTEEQLKQRDEQLDKAFSGKSENKSVNEKLEKLDKMGVDQKTQKAAVSSMSGTFTKVALAYEDVPGLADAAAWNGVSRCLYALDNGVELSLTVDLSDDDKVNKEKAIELMKQLLNNCN